MLFIRRNKLVRRTTGISEMSHRVAAFWVRRQRVDRVVHRLSLPLMEADQRCFGGGTIAPRMGVNVAQLIGSIVGTFYARSAVSMVQ